MEDIINTNTFIQHLVYFIKIGIYINKGTDKDALLERCIKLYNKYKSIEASNEYDSTEKDRDTTAIPTVTTDDKEKNDAFMRKCIKRLNLILKVNVDGTPVDITNKENQLRMVFLKEHPSLGNDDMCSMIEHATKYNINIISEVPLMFILRESKYRELLWQYTRSLFYISQILISKVDANADCTNATVIEKKKVMEKSVINLEVILGSIADIEEEIKLNQKLAVDKFLNSKLIKTGINENKINDAKHEVREIFNKRGLGNDASMNKMIDSISEKLTTADFSKGNFIENMFSIARNVAHELKDDLGSDPEKFQSKIGIITDIFKDTISDTSEQRSQVSPDLKNMFNQLIASSPMNADQGEMSQEEVSKCLESIIQSNGLNQDQFYNSIKDEQGDINIDKLEKMLAGMQ